VQAGKLSALGQMSAGISHELNQPLMAIQNFAENARAFQNRGQTDRAADNIGRIADMTQRMSRIIRNLRAFARQESAPVERVNLVEIVASAIELTRGVVAQGQVTLAYTPPSKPIWVRGGEVRLSQVFVNLITNAVDAMAQSEHRVLAIDIQNDTRLAVAFRDTGPGIDMPDKMFEPFYSTKTDQEDAGMGLGLSISYGIVQSFGGDIRGYNTEDGACFSVELDPWDKVTEAAQ
jgi:two-component system C4-dicarboxylate transport sensor histidine kinase DctB